MGYLICDIPKDKLDEIEEYITTISNYSTNYIINKIVDMFNISQNEALDILNTYLK